MHYYRRNIADYLRDTAHLSLLEHGILTRLFDVYFVREEGIPDAQAERLIGARTPEEKETTRHILQEFFLLATPENPVGFCSVSVEEPTWVREECEREILAVSQRSETAKMNGKKGGRPPKKPAQNRKNADQIRKYHEKTDLVSSGLAKQNPEESYLKTLIPKDSKTLIPPIPPTTGRTGGGRRGVHGRDGTEREALLAALDAEFERWWEAYPRKVGKGAARRAYGSAIRKGGVTCQQLLEALRAYQFDPREQFIPHPATWLNGERWSDEQESGDPVLRAAGLNDDGTLRAGTSTARKRQPTEKPGKFDWMREELAAARDGQTIDHDPFGLCEVDKRRPAAGGRS